LNLRRRFIAASEPDAPRECRLTREEGQRRAADTNRLFVQLAEQRETENGSDFVFKGDHEALWEDVTLFVQEEAQCCPFFSYEIIEEPDGVTLRVGAPPALVDRS
jgi:hypothetical protein